MKNEFDENNRTNKEYGSSSLDYYNDEISRKAVGRLFEDVEGEIAVSGEDSEPVPSLSPNPGPRPGSERVSERPINNRYYEEERVRPKEKTEEEGIVRGFERDEPEVRTERRTRRPEPRMTEPISGATEPIRPIVSKREDLQATAPISGRNDADKEERERYRKQFLNDMDNDRRPARRPDRPERLDRVERPDKGETLDKGVRPERTQRPQRPVGADESRPPRKKPGSLEEYRQEARKPLRPKKPEQEIEELNNAEKRYSKRAPQEAEPKIQKAKQGGVPGKRVNTPNYGSGDSGADLLSQPIFKIIGGVGIVAVLIMIFLGLKINSLSKELKAFREAQTNLVADQATLDALNATIDDYAVRISDLKEENNTLLLTLESYTGGNTVSEGESEDAEGGTSATGGGGTYTVVSGDSLSKISEQFYGNSTTGVDKIKAANGMTSDSLQIGQVLTIPE